MISLLALASPDPVTPPDINPGDLFSLEYVPTGLRDGSPLLVVLHACEQSAADVDVETGWVREADRLGFALLFPEQKPANNSFRCFNWFRPGDIERENGEARSIAEMVNEMLSRHRLDANRVYITGLSAGAAMAQVMLATYPDVFAAGALIAGVPYGCGTDPASAFDCLNDPGVQDWGASLPETSAPWPRVSVWQGTGDTIVAPRNADALVSQWRAAHLQGPEAEIGSIPGGTRRQWGAPVTVVEQVILDDLAHGTPIAPDVGCGEIAPFTLDAGVCAAEEIARFFELDQPSEAPPRYVTSENVPAPPPSGCAAASPLILLLLLARPRILPRRSRGNASGG